MSCYYRQNSVTEVTIPKYIKSSTGVTYYDIKVRVLEVEWLVERRYKDFDCLNEKLGDEIAISKKFLPPKKMVGNRNIDFLQQRRQQLEKYLQELLVYFRAKLPRVLVEFLDFNKYDIIFLLHDMAKLFSESGDSLLNVKKEYTFSALEVHAISECVCLPCPPGSSEQRGKFDFSHVLDFCTQLQVLIVTPVKENSTFDNVYNMVDVPIGRSNIIPKNLLFNLNAFRNLKVLKFFGLSTENIVEIDMLKPKLETICVHNTTITHINQVLMCDNVHRDAASAALNCEQHSTSSMLPPFVSLPSSSSSAPTLCSLNEQYVSACGQSIWHRITELDFTGNLLTQIDCSIRSAVQLHKLMLAQNRIRAIQNLAELPHLQVLSLAVNLISDCHDWHLQLGNLATLNLSQNKLQKLHGLRKLLSLVNLDLSCNQIDDLDEIDNVACLPILETLHLTGNPLASIVDYRPRVLARFHERAEEILLDSEGGTPKELDTALVLSALHKSKLRQNNNTNLKFINKKYNFNPN